MSYQALEEAFAHPKLTISKLHRFRRELLQQLCEVNSIDVQQKGTKKPTKAIYATALFNTRPAASKKADAADPKWPKIRMRGDTILIALSPILTLKMTKKPTSTVISEENSRTGAQSSLVPNNAPPPKLGTEAAAQSVGIDGSGLRIRTPVLKRKREKEGITDEQAKKSKKSNRRPTTAEAGAGQEQHLKSDKKNSILIRAYLRRGDDTHISEAEVKINSTGDLAVEHVAEELKLKGILRLIYPRNRYLYDLSSKETVLQEEIEELQDTNGVLMVTFDKNYSKQTRPKRHIIEFLHD